VLTAAPPTIVIPFNVQNLHTTRKGVREGGWIGDHAARMRAQLSLLSAFAAFS
jgi:hypothetical protein